MGSLSIGIISPEFPPQIGGVERYAFEYAKALAGQGHKVTVFTRPHPEGEINNEGFEVRNLLRRDYRTDREVVRSQPMDAWHVMNAAYAWVALETKVPVVVSVHGNDFLRPYLPLRHLSLPLPDRFIPDWVGKRLAHWGQRRTVDLMQKGLAQAAVILTNSRYTEKVFLENFPHLAGHTLVGLVGVSAHLLNSGTPHRSRDGITRFITISRLAEPRKNVHLVIKALARLKSEFSFTYRIIGDGAEKAVLEDLVSSLGLGDRIQFLGRLPEEDMVSELSRSDLFVLCSSVLPSSHEGFGIVYLEANACGVPALGAKLAGAAEAIAENHSGFFVDEPTEAEIEAALRAFLSGEKRFSSEDCREFASRFTWGTVVGKALPFYTSPAP